MYLMVRIPISTECLPWHKMERVSVIQELPCRKLKMLFFYHRAAVLLFHLSLLGYINDKALRFIYTPSLSPMFTHP